MSTSRSRPGNGHAKRMAYLRSIGAGGYTSAAPMDARIRFLHDQRGITFITIADRCGVNLGTVKAHYHGRWSDGEPTGDCFMGVARKVLSAKFGPEDGYRFPAVGIRRRLQALQAGGFPLSVPAELLGRDRTQVHAMMCGKTNKHFVLRELAEATVGVYDKLEVASPSDWGVPPKAETYARNRARKNGYSPSHCWDPDTIDDPMAYPEWTGECGTVGGYRIHRRERIPMCGLCSKAIDEYEGGVTSFDVEAFARVRTARGFSQARLEREMGVSKGTVNHWESERSMPSAALLDAAVTVLGCTFEDISESEN